MNFFQLKLEFIWTNKGENVVYMLQWINLSFVWMKFDQAIPNENEFVADRYLIRGVAGSHNKDVK